MLLKALFGRLNARQILIHFLASWPVIYSFKILSYLNNPRLFKMLIPGNKPDIQEALQQGLLSIDDFSSYYYYIDTAWIAGFLLTLIISTLLSVRMHWSLLNSLIAFLLIYLACFDPFGWQKNPDRNFFSLQPVHMSFFWTLATGIPSLVLGLWLFFSRKITAYIFYGV